MEAWSISLLGAPYARRGDQELRLRSKETRAVLACLLLRARLSAPYSSPPVLPRQTLAERYWGDKSNPRVNLRQAIDALRGKFGPDCFTSGLDTIQVTPGAFVTDIDRIRDAYQQALTAPPEERLELLIQAEGEMNGPFLEACLQTGDEGQPWLIAQRAEVHSWLASILLTLAGAFEAAGNANGAMDAIRHALRYQPASVPLQKHFWRLAEVTGQEAVLPVIEADATFTDVVKRLAEKDAAQLTGKETRFFNALYRAELDQLPPEAQKAIPRLAVLPAPFSATVAKEVADVSRQTLATLSRTPLLHQQGDEFVLSKVVRTCAWGPVPTSTKNRLETRLASVCTTWLDHLLEQRHKPLRSPFVDLKQAAPFLIASLQWHLKQSPTIERLHFIGGLNNLGLIGPVDAAIAYLDQTRKDEAHPLLLRYVAGHIAGDIHFKRNEFADAIFQYEQALPLVPASLNPARDEAGLHFALGNAYHYAGDSQTAVTHLQKAQAIWQQIPNLMGVANALRVQCEIQNHLGEYEPALQACEEALSLRRAVETRWNPVADAVFWKGVTLWRLGKPAEAASCLEEALSIWQDTGDLNGVGLCLRMMGQLRAAQGSFAEARAHLDHAILLHERVGDTGSRLAAVESKADVFVQEGRPQNALPLYEERLADHETRQHQKGIQRLRTRIQQCQTEIANSGSGIDGARDAVHL